MGNFYEIINNPTKYLGYSVIIMWYQRAHKQCTQADLYGCIKMDTEGFWIKRIYNDEINYISNDTEGMFNISIDEEHAKIVISMYENEGISNGAIKL